MEVDLTGTLEVPLKLLTQTDSVHGGQLTTWQTRFRQSSDIFLVTSAAVVPEPQIV